MPSAPQTSAAPRPQPSPAPADPAAESLAAAFRRRQLTDHLADGGASPRERFEALAAALREMLAERWLRTERTYASRNPKRVYYLSMEFLIGRSAANNVLNLGAEPTVRAAMDRLGFDWRDLAEQEPDAGLGNGGLGRLAACFLDSMATIGLPAIGYGLRYEFGIFRQEIRRGRQVEQPDHWLRRADPWEVARPDEAVPVNFGGSVRIHSDGDPADNPRITTVLGVPYDRPVVGYGGRTVNTLRLWGSSAPEFFDFADFSRGDFFGAVHDKIAAESLTRVLYPDDSTEAGRELRLRQEYFLVACSLMDILTRFRRSNAEWKDLPDKVAIQLNDTHPALAVAEMMALLMDWAGLGWDQAWDLTVRTLAYTNHTLMPEALEKWPVAMFESLLPRHLEIIYEINRRFLDDVRAKSPDADLPRRVSLIEEGPVRKVRMAHLAVVGTHGTNGVAELHSRLLTERVLHDFAGLYPQRFRNVTNGITPRRWLLLANPGLAALITEAVGDKWITELDELARLKPLAGDASFRERFAAVKRQAKVRLGDWLARNGGPRPDPDWLFDVQIKRIHEYKRQLLNILHVIIHYNRLREGRAAGAPPRVFLFAGKAAPAYHLAKAIIALINGVAARIEADPAVRDHLRVHFLPNYGVTLAERLIPAADVSEQISTAGTEASGTSNMKFMLNGALTIGTLDGATIEMVREAGEENFFLFGLNAEQVAATKAFYSPRWHYDQEPEVKRALDQIAAGHFSGGDRSAFACVWDAIMTHGDPYLHLADMKSYDDAHRRIEACRGRPDEWRSKAVLNVAAAGRFSSDRTIRDYARDIWKAEPCPVE
jgi:starch phosphorylase